MGKRLPVLGLVAALFAGSSGAAQAELIGRLAPRFEVAVVGSQDWFRVGLELVEAELNHDVRAAMATAERLWSVAEKSPVPGARLAVAALAELVAVRLDGPKPAASWRERAGQTEGPVDAMFLAAFHLARARCLCVCDRHDEELEHAIPGEVAAEQSGDGLMRLLAVHQSLHSTPRRDQTSLRKLYASVVGGPRGQNASFFEPLLLVEEGKAAHGLSERAALLDQAELAAERHGNRRVLYFVLELRCHLHFRSDALDLVIDCCRRAGPILEQLGDRHLSANNLDMHAYALVLRGEMEAAQHLLAAADVMVHDRGMVRLERDLVKTRLELAIRQRDGDRVAEISAELDEMEAETQRNDGRLAQARAALRRAESERAEAEERLREASLQALERTRNQRTWAGVGVSLGMAVLAFVTWRSRRRLLLANAALAEQVEQVEAAREAKARLEERLREIERTESLGTMAAGVAHDFNNLLTGILGSAELLHAGDASPETKAAAENIARAGQQAARLCRQLQIYSGGAPLQQAPLNLVALVRSLLPVLQASVCNEVEVALACDRDAIGVLADRAQIEQVLLNLVVNARDAKARHVRIVVAPGVADPLPMTRIDVTDDGEGMPPEVAQRVFDPFFTTRFPGRGLGLAVVYGVARRHGGSVAVTSAPGLGTTFTLLLPAVAPPAPLAEPVVVLPALPPAGAATLLVVDDDDAVQQMLTSMLRHLGRAAAAFADGPSLLAAMENLPASDPVVLFVDLAMPNMDGCEVIRRARECRPGVRVVLMSGHDIDFVEQVAGEVVPDHVMAKPFRIEALRVALAAALASIATTAGGARRN